LLAQVGVNETRPVMEKRKGSGGGLVNFETAKGGEKWQATLRDLAFFGGGKQGRMGNNIR